MGEGFERWGIVRMGATLGWMPESGFGRWLPFWAKSAIVDAWNMCACCVVGHDWVDDVDGVYCANCSKEKRGE